LGGWVWEIKQNPKRGEIRNKKTTYAKILSNSNPMNKNLALNIRFMCQEDLPQVNQIDHEAFPTLWPPPNYQRELKNGLAHYIVVVDKEQKYEPPEPPKATPKKGLSGWLARLRPRSNHNHPDSEPQPAREYILGFAGLWLMAGEAHITNIAVREKYRRRGIGELLLISLIELSLELGAHLVTLEVRASNTTAQNLYAKYGFVEVGLRRGYYTDNREDGVLMTLEDVTSAPAQANLRQLKQAHARRWRMAIPTPPPRASLHQSRKY
jgi:ribosomal-protein-alanine N-acetyltransferase